MTSNKLTGESTSRAVKISIYWNIFINMNTYII